MDQSLLLNLQDDFNSGQPFDMTLYNEPVRVLVENVGLDMYQAFEAVLIVGNDPDQAIAYYFNEENVKLQMRSEAVQKRGMSLLTFDQMSDMMQELEALRREYRNIWLSRITAEAYHEDYNGKNKLYSYQEFLKGITSTRFLSLRKIEKIDDYRKENSISDEEHWQCLLAVGISEAMFEKMKDTSTAPSRFACVNCYQNQTDYIMLDCMHLCLCGDCIDQVTEISDPVCPVCKSNVRQARRIYRS